MKNRLLVILLVTLVTTDVQAQAPSQNVSSPFAVVELFTSEGCSSCPPADRLLTQITEEAYRDQKRIFTLGFHIDYWDYLGWRDSFSDKRFSDRQRLYAKVHRSQQIYTPQMVINGRHAFVGSDVSLANRYINEALSQSSQNVFHFKSVDSKPKAITVSYELTAVPENSVLHLVFVERGLSSDVLRGENAGKQLTHTNVVKVFQTIQLRNTVDQSTILIPTGVNLENSSIIGFIQDTNTMTILGADSIGLSK